MTQIMDAKTDRQPSDDHKQISGSLFKTGGHNLIAVKPVVTSDSKYLLIPSDGHLRRYVVQTGAFIASHDFGHKTNVISAHIMAKNKDEVMVASSDGLVIVWNLSDNRKVDEFQIQLKTQRNETMIWCQLVNNYFYFTTVKPKRGEEDRSVCQLQYCPKHFAEQRLYMNRNSHVNPTPNAVAFCPSSDPRYCVAIHENILYVYDIPVTSKSSKKRHLIKDDKQFTCIACHPSLEMIATGDSLGRILIWNDFVDNNFPSRSVLHWHQLPVADLCLSPEGASLYSVGAEMTLVRWDISGGHFGAKNFMPRLGLAIKYVTIDANNHMIVTSHEDNTIQILGPQMKGIKCVIEGMTKGVESDVGLSTGLVWNRKMSAITMNGRTGLLQFYSPSFQKQLFQLDVVQQNLISSTRDHSVIATEVTKAAVSEDGLWLSSVEMRDDFETLPEIRLKFWKLKDSLKNYSLNTTIHLPHKSRVNCLQFAPNSRSMVSTSDDKEFKVWNLVKDDDKQWWKCIKVGDLNSVSIPLMANWSSDSSLLAIAYKSFITLWDVSDEWDLKYMSRLSAEEKSASKVISIDFGYEDKSHYLIECHQFFIQVWNLLDMSLFWRHKTYEPIVCIAFNKWENKLAIGLTQMITFFTVDSDTPIGVVNIDAKDQRMVTALFTDECPDKLHDSKCGQLLKKTKFYCMNDRQELFTIRHLMRTEVIPSLEAEDILSPLAVMLMNKNQRKERLNNEEFDDYFKTNTSIRKLVDDMFFNVPSHVLPPIPVLCETFITSLNKCRQKDDIKDDTDFKMPSDLQMKNSFDVQSDSQSNSTAVDTNDREVEMEIMNRDESLCEEDIDFIDEDYQWLKRLDSTNE